MDRRRVILALIASLGLTAAGAAWITAPAPEDDPDLDDLRHSKRHIRELERIAGKSGVLVNDLDDWLATLWEGRTRAVTILVGTGCAAGLYALLTRRPAP